MNFNCIFFLALALFGVVSHAYIASSGIGYGAIGALGYNGMYNSVCRTPCGAGFGGSYEGGYGCRTACGSAAVCDSCQCMKTIVRPSIVERIPYSCSRRVQSTSCRPACELYSGGIRGGAGIEAVTGAGCSGYMNGGYLY